MDLVEPLSSAWNASADMLVTDDIVETLRRSIVEKLTYATGRDPLIAGDHDWFVATALALRDHIIDRWLKSTREDTAQNRNLVCPTSRKILPRITVP